MRENGKQEGGDTVGPGVTGHPCSISCTARTDSSTVVHSYEVRLVLEFCDKGCLRDALDDGIFTMGPGLVNYLAILDTAADVAKAMLHLHTLNVLHADLKARNVMLATGSTDGRGLVGKVGDFGLSLQMNHLETHISSVYQGTMTHMAPEIMLDGRVSKAADVYAFGITLWEPFTCGRAFEGVPRALLGHQITKEHLRPRFPEGTPRAYKELAEKCWHSKWELRPTFGAILEELLTMRAADPRPTPAVHVAPRLWNYEAGGKSNSTISNNHTIGSPGPAGCTDTSPIIQASLPREPVETECERSYYLDSSADDSDILVLRGWNQGASGISLEVRSMTRSRAAYMPKISEAETTEGKTHWQHAEQQED